MAKYHASTFLIAQVSTASISFISSSFIAGGIIRSDGGLTSPYRRIIFGISLSDILQSLAAIFGPLSVPKSSPVGIWAMGNDFTCRTDGFFITFTAGSTPMYMFGLCLYTAFKMTTTISDKEFCRKYEKKMHIAIFSINLALAVFALATKSIGSSIIGNCCMVAASPTGCRLSPELVGECEQEIDYVFLLAIVTSIWISFLSLLGIVCCMVVVCIYNLRRKRFNNPPSISSRKGSTSSSPDFNFDSSTMMPPPSPASKGGELRQGDDGQKRSQDDSMVVSLNHKTVQAPETSTSNAAVQKSFSLIHFYRKEIILQACCFVFASLVTFSCYWAVQFQVLVLEGPPEDDLFFAAVLTFPSGGFFNMIAYTRPKIAFFRSRHPEYSLLRALWHVIKTGGDVMRQEPIQDRGSPNAMRGCDSRSVAFGVAQHIPADGVFVGSSMLRRSSEPAGRNSKISALTPEYEDFSTIIDIKEHRNNVFEGGLSSPREEQKIHVKGPINPDLYTGVCDTIFHAVDEGSILDACDRPTLPMSNHFKEDIQVSKSFTGGEDLVENDHYDEETRSSVLNEQGADFGGGYSDLDLLRDESDVQEDVEAEESVAEKDPVRRAYAKAMKRVKGLQ
jgi:hypothetical protein